MSFVCTSLEREWKHRKTLIILSKEMPEKNLTSITLLLTFWYLKKKKCKQQVRELYLCQTPPFSDYSRSRSWNGLPWSWKVSAHSNTKVHTQEEYAPHRQRGGQRRKRKNTAVDGVQRKAGGGVQREKGVERELELVDFIRIAVMVQSKLVFAKLLMN